MKTLTYIQLVLIIIILKCFDFVCLIYCNLLFRVPNCPVCLVPGCKASKDLPIYSFPLADKRLLHKWLDRTGLSIHYDMNIYSILKICKSHFHEDCVDEKTMQLKPFAIPSMNLIGKFFLLGDIIEYRVIKKPCIENKFIGFNL